MKGNIIMGEYEKKYELITDTIPKIHVDVNDEQVPLKSLRGTWSVHPDLIFKKEGFVALENFPAGATVRYIFWTDEVQYYVEGKAELTYSMPRTRYSIEKKMTVQKGDAILIPCGADITFKIDEAGPLCKFCVIMPAPPPTVQEAMPPEARWPE
jgi:mannose-6-phosphate isomerase-like protein (cupin superfamily)